MPEREPDLPPLPRRLLGWIYLARVILVAAVLAGALVGWGTLAPDVILATAMFVVALAGTAVSFWWTHLLGRQPGANFRYLQVLLDLVLVSATVYMTQGAESDFVPLFILVISEGALLLPLYGGVLMGILATVLFSAVVVGLGGGTLDTELALQLSLFAGVAVATGLLVDRLRRAGTRLGAVESELRQLRLDTDEILDSLSTGVLTVDGEARLVYMNYAAGRLLGVDPHAYLGQPVDEAFTEAAPAMGGLLKKSVEDRVPVLRFKTSLERDGKPLTLGVSTTVMIRDEDEPASTTAIFQDITNKERADILDRRNQRLEAVAELSASLAHEIKNPLASIRSSVEQLTSEGLEKEDQAVLSRLVLEESDRLSRLLSEFLEFSALRMGEASRLDLAELARGAVRMAEQHPDAPDGARVVCDGMGEPVYIPGDSDLLHRAVYNLVLNALQFAGPDGTVRVGLVRPGEARPPAGVDVAAPVQLSVCDSGPGIPDDEVSRVFDPFYTTRPDGNGLGLAVVHRAVEAHRGAVLAANGPLGGAEFTLYLPGREDSR